ncbi:MAG: RHS repeat-associated core domain-containing protein [Christensenellales bacterium]
MDWTYKSGANGSATSLLSTYANGSDAKYNYDYDANGNITRIWRGNTSFTNASEKYSYVYDSANQLVRENLYYGSGNSSNATITYEYDIWGNLLNKKIYAYTVGTLGTARETVPYAYTNSAWKDQLTSYDGESITYDASGNPTNYLGATLVWEGQRLKSYTPKAASSGRANSYVYSYDENGIRTRKTIGSTVTDYYYNGTLLMGTVKTTTNSDGSTTTSKLRFSYDANGKVVAVNYNGNYYYYLRNAQSDIVKLIDKTGATVVEYRYDSWGKLLSTSGSLASTLGKNNPFRYRGYVYDEETGFYYLQSRYYNPEVGRFISSDVLLSTGQGVLGHNAYAYCLNNPVNREDSNGNWSMPNWLKVTIGAVALVGAVALTVATGGGAAAVAVGVAKVVGSVAVSTAVSAGVGYLENGKQGAIDGACNGFMFGSLSACGGAALKYANVHAATTGSPNSMGKAGERMAGIEPSAKRAIRINGRVRIPDELTQTTLKEVKNVKYISNTLQLRDFADYAKITGRTLELWVRPTTKIAKTVIDAGWNIRYLW